MKYFVDIDNTICETNGLKYKDSKPINKNIEKINKLYDADHTIIYWTSRGKGSKNLGYIKPLTSTQLKKWNCKYHELRFNKPIFDVFIDDKAINSDMFFNEDN